MLPTCVRSAVRPAALAAVLAAVALLRPAGLTAQSVEGTLVEGPRQAPVRGALVVLLDAGGREVARRMTDAEGRFVLRAPAPGEYRVRADRVGFGSTTSAPLRLAAGEPAGLRLVAVEQVVQLQGIRAEARASRRCATRPEAGIAVVTLWEEARKALSLAEVTREQGGDAFTVRTFRRALDPATEVVQAEDSRTAQTRSLHPFLSLPADDLARGGYVREDSAGLSYYSPDAGVLLSDEFVAGHCFHVEEPADPATGLVGLAFEPVRGRELPDVKGVLWLDRATAELHSLRFSFTQLPYGARGDWGGWVRFHRLENGGWVVRRWAIRMPAFYDATGASASDPVLPEESCPRCVVARREDADLRDRYLLAQVVEQGGEVERIVTASGEAAVLSERPALMGMVFDSMAGRPLAAARVFLAGTPYTARTDPAGRFTVEGVSEGRYAVTFEHPRADTLGFVHTPATVQVRAGGENRVELAIAGIPPARVAAAERAARGGRVRAAADDPARAIALEGVEATAERQVRFLANQGFYQRRRSYRGTFITGEDIAQKLPARAVDLVRGVHGIVPRPSGPHLILTQRRLDRHCMVPLYVDGVLSAHSILDRLRASEITGIEVYSASFVPPQFNPYRDGRACGAVVVWTSTAAR